VLSHEVDGLGSDFFGGQREIASFSRSSSSTTTIMRPARISSIAVGTSVKGELGVMWVTRRSSLALRRREFPVRAAKQILHFLTTHRNATAITIKNKTAMLPAAIGCCVASQVRATARVSSPAESAKFETGSEPGSQRLGLLSCRLMASGERLGNSRQKQLSGDSCEASCAVCHRAARQQPESL